MSWSPPGGATRPHYGRSLCCAPCSPWYMELAARLCPDNQLATAGTGTPQGSGGLKGAGTGRPHNPNRGANHGSASC